MFDTIEDAVDHARCVQAVDASVNLQVSAAHEWFCMAASPEAVADDKALRQHVSDLLASYKEARESADKEFKSNVSKRVGGKGLDGRARAGAAATAANAMDKEALKSFRKAPKIGRSAEVREQSYLAVSFVSDTISELPQPLVRVYGAFNTEKEADVYVRNTCGDHVKDHDIYVVCACEWLHPQSIDPSKVREVFRSEELTSVIKNHKSQGAQCKSFQEWRDNTPRSERVDVDAGEGGAGAPEPAEGAAGVGDVGEGVVV